MYDLARPEWLSLFGEIYLTTIIMFLVLFGVFYQSESTLGIQPKNPVGINITMGLGIQTVFITALLLSNNISIQGLTMFSHDDFGQIIATILLISLAFYFLILTPLVKKDPIYTFEYIVLILCAALGMILLIKSNDLIAMYLSLELQSLSFYILAAYRRTSPYGTESGLKYYIMGGFSSAILLFGMALLYGLTGITHYSHFDLFLIDTPSFGITVAYFFILAGLLFKIAAVPFHMWAPDVYQGSALGTTAFFSIVPKLSIITGIYRLIAFQPLDALFQLLSWVAIASILTGTLLGLVQTNIKRLFSYSSIAHVGFILFGITIGTPLAWESSYFYIFLYIIMTLIAFSIFISLKEAQGLDVENGTQYFWINNLKNLGTRQPFLALAFAITLFSMAGIPPLAGFYSKFFILWNAIQQDYFLLAFAGILGSGIAAVYYIRLVQLMFFYNPSLELEKEMNYSISGLNSMVISLCLFFLMFFFLKPDFLLLGVHNIIS